MEKQHPASELTEEVAKIIYEGIEAGLPNRMAHEMARVRERCFYKWMEKGDRDIEDGRDTVYSNFVQTIKEIRARSATAKLRYLDKDENKNWQSKAWLLERCHAKYFSQNAQEIELMKEEMAQLKALLSQVVSPNIPKNDDE